ncbi:MAG: hypothetical protein LBU14_00875 [Candidatus Peribacteria bacterium]|jgi:hypothetical protein|nr:hypothetical protein [Candidatus Peribacteria bacterium]
MLSENIRNYIKLIVANKTKPNNNIPVSGKVFDEKELENMIEAIFDCHWTE